MALLAIAPSAGWKSIVEALVLAATLPGKKEKNPWPEGATAVTLTATAWAPTGTLQAPPICSSSGWPLVKGDPLVGGPGLRVSSTRQGVVGRNPASGPGTAS